MKCFVNIEINYKYYHYIFNLIINFTTLSNQQYFYTFTLKVYLFCVVTPALDIIMTHTEKIDNSRYPKVIGCFETCNFTTNRLICNSLLKVQLNTRQLYSFMHFYILLFRLSLHAFWFETSNRPRSRLKLKSCIIHINKHWYSLTTFE